MLDIELQLSSTCTVYCSRTISRVPCGLAQLAQDDLKYVGRDGTTQVNT